MGLAPSSPAGLARGSSTKSLLSPTFNGSSANLLSGTTNRGSGSNEPQSARRVPPHIGQQGRHPTSRRAGSKLDLIKVSITEDPAVLRDAQWCAAFRLYLCEAYEADLLASAAAMQRSSSVTSPTATPASPSSASAPVQPLSEELLRVARKLAVVARQYFNFWADLTDLEWCPGPSALHTLRLESICDKYLSRGADDPVQLSTSVRINLLGEDGACSTTSKQDIEDARDEAFRYLSSEVLPWFVRSTSAMGLPACLYKTKRVVWTLEDAAKKVNTHNDVVSLLQRVRASMAFRAFLQARGDPTLARLALLAVQVLGLKSLLDHWALQRCRLHYKKTRSSTITNVLGRSPFADQHRNSAMTALASSDPDKTEAEPASSSTQPEEGGQQHPPPTAASPRSNLPERSRLNRSATDGRLCAESRTAMIVTSSSTAAAVAPASPKAAPTAPPTEEELQLQLRATLELGCAHEIFDAHLRLGEPLRALLPPQVVQSLLSKLGGPGQFGGVSVDIYDELLGYVVTYLHEVTNDFYQSPQYTELLEEESLPTAAASLSRASLNVVGRTLSEAEAGARAAMLDVLQTPTLQASFRRYVEHSCGKKVSDKQALCTLRFVLAVDDVARIRRPSAVEGESGQTMATFAGNSKIMSSYVRRGAPCELSLLAGRARVQLMERVLQPGALSDPSLLEDWRLLAVDALAAEWLPSFEPTSWPVEVSSEASSTAPQPSEAPASPKPRTPLGALRGSQGRLSATSSSSVLSLADVLELPTGCALLRRFAADEGTSAPLLFWLEAEDYRLIPRPDLMLSRARAIVHKYIADEAVPSATSARRPLPLPARCREAIVRGVQVGGVGAGLFLEAQTLAYAWMEADLLPRFVAACPKDHQVLLAAKGLADAPDGATPLSPATGTMRREGSISRSPNSGGGKRRSRNSMGPLLADELIQELLRASTCSRPSKSIMARILQHPTTLAFFREFARQRGQAGPVMFWLDAEDFRHQLAVNNLAFRRSQAAKLAGKYIVEAAPLQVALDEPVRQALLDRLDAPPRGLFKEAQRDVLRQLAANLLSDFMASPEIREMTEAQSLSRQTPWRSFGQRISRLWGISSGRPHKRGSSTSAPPPSSASSSISVEATKADAGGAQGEGKRMSGSLRGSMTGLTVNTRASQGGGGSISPRHSSGVTSMAAFLLQQASMWGTGTQDSDSGEWSDSTGSDMDEEQHPPVLHDKPALPLEGLESKAVSGAGSVLASPRTLGRSPSASKLVDKRGSNFGSSVKEGITRLLRGSSAKIMPTAEEQHQESTSGSTGVEAA